MAKAFVWRDKIDANQYWVGVRGSTGQFYGCIPMFVGAIGDCFGTDAYDFVKGLEPGGLPAPVSLELTDLKEEKP